MDNLPPLRTHQANRLPQILRGRAYPTRPVAEDHPDPVTAEDRLTQDPEVVVLPTQDPEVADLLTQVLMEEARLMVAEEASPTNRTKTNRTKANQTKETEP